MSIRDNFKNLPAITLLLNILDLVIGPTFTVAMTTLLPIK